MGAVPGQERGIDGKLLPRPGSEYRPPCARDGCEKPVERGRRLCASCRRKDKKPASVQPRKNVPSTRLDAEELPEVEPMEVGPFDSTRQAVYLEHLACGYTRKQARAAAGARSPDVLKQRRLDPVFAEAELDAEEVACEEIEAAMRTLALRGHFQAQQWILSNRAPKRWTSGQTSKVEISGQVTHELDVTDRVARIQALQATLAERAALQSGQVTPVLDVEEVAD